MDNRTVLQKRERDRRDANLITNYDILLAAVKKNGTALYYADDSLTRNYDIVLAAVQEDGCALQFADPSLRKNHDIVLAAVQQDGEALFFTDDYLKNDYEIVLTAVQNYPYAYGALPHSSALRKNCDIFSAAVSKQESLWDCVGEDVTDDEFFLSTLMRQGISFLIISKYASKRIIEKYNEDTLRNISIYIKKSNK